MFQERKVGRPQKPSEQRRTERVVIMLTPAEKQRLQQYVDKESMSVALREAANIIYKVELDVAGTGTVQWLHDLESFIQEIRGALRNGDIEITIKSERAVIKVKGGHIFFQAPQPLITKSAVEQEFKRLEQRCRSLVEGSPIGDFIFQGDRFKYVSPRIIDVAEALDAEVDITFQSAKARKASVNIQSSSGRIEYICVDCLYRWESGTQRTVMQCPQCHKRQGVMFLEYSKAVRAYQDIQLQVKKSPPFKKPPPIKSLRNIPDVLRLIFETAGTTFPSPKLPISLFLRIIEQSRQKQTGERSACEPVIAQQLAL